MPAQSFENPALLKGRPGRSTKIFAIDDDRAFPRRLGDRPLNPAGSANVNRLDAIRPPDHPRSIARDLFDIDNGWVTTDARVPRITRDSRHVGDAVITLVRTPPGALHIEPVPAPRRPLMAFRLIVALGGAVFESVDSRIVLQRGDMLLIDLADQGSLISTHWGAWLTLALPRSAVQDRMAGAESLPAIVIRRRGAMASLFRSCLTAMWRTGAQLEGKTCAGLADALTDMLMQAVLEEGQSSSRPEMQRVQILQRVTAEIHTCLSDFDLDAALLAARLGLGERALRTLLGSVSPRDLIRRTRLAVARRLLRSGIGSGVSITEVARRVGFRNASHFSDTYTREHGVSPVCDRSESRTAP